MDVFILGRQRMLNTEMHLPGTLHWKTSRPPVCRQPRAAPSGFASGAKAGCLRVRLVKMGI